MHSTNTYHRTGHVWLGVAAVFCVALAACNRTEPHAGEQAFGDVRQGRFEIYRAACGSCHVIPGVVGALGSVGPPLDEFGNRKIVAGMLPNTLDNLALWIAHPQQVVPGNVMPDMGLNKKQARDIAAYLESLR